MLSKKLNLVPHSFFKGKALGTRLEKAVSICRVRKDSTRQKGKKKFNFQQYQSFEHNSMKIYDQQRLESLEEKKAAHMRTWCQKDLQT